MPYRYRMLGLVASLIIVMYLDRLCIAVAGPRIQADLKFSTTDWGWVIGAFTLAYAAFEVPSGMLADRIGPRRVITRIVLWWSTFTFATGLVTGLRSMLIVRFLFGAGEAGAFPSTASVISRWIPPSERGRSNSIIWISSGFGGILTPLLVVPIQQGFGWRAAFLLLGLVGIIWSLLWYTKFRDSPQEVPAISKREREAIGYTPAVQHIGVPWQHLLRQRNYLLLLGMYHCYCWGGYFYLSWLPTYLQMGRGLTEDAMKFAASITSAAGMFGTIGGGFLSDALVRRAGLRAGRCLPAAAGLMLSGLLLGAASFTVDNLVAVAELCLGLASMNFMLPVTWALCLDLGRRHAGSVTGSMNMAGQVGSLISSVAFGYLVKWLGSYNQALVPLAVMLVLSGLLYLGIDPAKPFFTEPEPRHQEALVS